MTFLANKKRLKQNTSPASLSHSKFHMSLPNWWNLICIPKKELQGSHIYIVVFSFPTSLVAGSAQHGVEMNAEGHEHQG